jgi:NAD(P)-dependent dehydrogenase (short-subunit alcohol dehydrogenase family)
MKGVARDTLETLFSLRGKTAIVTGAAGYLGQVFTQALLEAGAHVVLMGRGEKLSAAVTRLRGLFGEEAVEAEAANFDDSEAYGRALRAVVSRHSIDILVNNAFEFSKQTGFNDPSGRLESLSKAQWMRSLEAGVFWHAVATQIVVEGMAKRETGSIINISSMYAVVSPDPRLYEGTNVFNPPTYGAAKAGLLALTRYTAAFYGSHGVRCNALLPGAFPNLGGDSYNVPRNEAFLQRLRDRAVLGRYGEPADLKGAIIFLASDASRFMTGQCLSVDGGWTIT